MEPAYIYRARPVSISDGDSMTVDVDLGMRVGIRVKLRLLGIDAPELGTPEGRASRDYLRTLIGSTPVTIRTHADPGDKYGRWLAVVHLGDLCVNEAMVSTGHAHPYDGGRRDRAGVTTPSRSGPGPSPRT